MSLKARRELLAATAMRYQNSSKAEKQIILDEFTASSGYHRKYAIGLLKNYAPDQPPKQKRPRKTRPRKYNDEVRDALVLVWEAANRICSKRLVPFLPEMVEVLENHGYLNLPKEVRARLLGISASTVDRLLYPIRWGQNAKGVGTTKPGALIKSQVTIRTFSEWDDDRPGFMEADLVAHCGTFTGGHFLQTLVMTDISTGWTEFKALLFRDQMTVIQAIRSIQDQVPFPLLGLDTDNGTEFLNYLLLEYCLEEEITFTRARPYKKNDQCFVEQKNGSIIRKFIGYDRFEGMQPYQILSALYEQLRLYVNFFQPSLKLTSKTREGARVIKKYDQARTPSQRLLADDRLLETSKQKLTEQYKVLDPVQLLASIRMHQDQLWELAYVAREGDDFENQQINRQPRMTRQPFREEPSSADNAPSSRPKLEPAERMYRRIKKPRKDGDGKRWWRTRVDPFADVIQEVKEALERTPYLNAKMMFQELQQKHPGKFTDGQLRTFQRRVSEWRVNWINAQSTKKSAHNDPGSVPRKDDLR